MFGKLEIIGNIEVVTGMHIGGTNEFSAIGAIDAPVIKDPLTRNPVIPGSTFKGKLRTLLSRYLKKGMPVEHSKDSEELLKLFGDSKNEEYRVGKLIFSDMILSNKEELHGRGAKLTTEVKFENTINRLTAVANPRQIERVIRGSKFPISIIYNAYNINEDEIKQDFEVLKKGFTLLEYDYLGGHGSRGSGKIKINDLNVQCVVGEIDDVIVDELTKILNK